MAGMIAPRVYHPGDLIYKEEPFAHVLRRSLKFIHCEACHKRGLDLKSCTSCRAVKYCGRECQKADWHDHKLECRHLKNLPDVPNQDFVRLLGKIILKIKDKKWKSIQKRVLKTDRSFDDLESNIEDIMDDPRLILFCKEIKALTKQFIGEENLPADDELFELIGKLKSNAFTDYSDDMWSAIYIFIGLKAFGHECIPNANIEVCKNVMKIWACKDIKKGSDKITINTQTSTFGRLVIGEGLFEHRRRCRCTDCSLPYCESILSKILDENKAFSVISETERYLQLAAILRRLDRDGDMHTIDELLKKQEGVLGRTHLLRLLLLDQKCVSFVGHPLQLLPLLKELCESQRMVYGDHSVKMKAVYEVLMVTNLQLGRLDEVAIYREKIRKLEIHSAGSGGFQFSFPLF